MKAKWIVETALALAAVTTAGCSETPAPRTAANATCEAKSIAVTSPPDRTAVAYRPVVTGTVQPACGNVWVLLRGPDQNRYWVQPRPAVAPDGHWTARVYVGTPTQEYGAVQGGGTFTLVAIANPTRALKPGEALYTVPDAEAQSKVVLLERGGPPHEPR